MEMIYCDHCKRDMTKERHLISWKITIDHPNLYRPPAHFCGFRCLTQWVYKKDVEAHKK